MSRSLIFIFAGILALVLICRFQSSGRLPHALNRQTNSPASNNCLSKLKVKALAAFVKENHLNPRYCFLIDMCRHSGTNRFFVYDLKKDSVCAQALVAHGCGAVRFSTFARFSNEVGSNCTAFGRYRIGGKYHGSFGEAYKLYGLDSSNSNAFLRSIVLHSYAEVPNQETYPQHIVNSLGCPMVCPAFFRQLSAIIDQSKQSLLLQIVN